MENKSIIPDWLEERFPEVSPREFYRTIFPAGELEKKDEYVRGQYTGIIVAVTDQRKPDGRRKVLRYTLTDDLDAVDTVTASDNFCLCSPLSYAGKQRTAANARFLYAIAVDVDKVRIVRGKPLGIENMWERHILKLGRLPKPTFIVSSGSGVHLYYVLTERVALFEDAARELQELKRELTELIWHDTIVDIKTSAEVQQEGIYQGFRMPGTITKNGGRARAFLTGDKVTIEYLNSFVSILHQARRVEKAKKQKKLSLAEAAEKYPEWHDRRVVRKEPRGAWAVNRNLYEWWKRRIIDGAKVGHRYYCMMMLAIYAQKCSRYDAKHNPNPVTFEELEHDSFELLDYMESMTNSDDNHFGADDVLDALEAFEERWVTYPRSAIEYRTAIIIPPSKRNKQSQRDHLEEARAIRDIRARRRGERWDAHNGRKSKLDVVQAWRHEHPDGRKVDCIRETGLDKKTVYKHWEAAEEDREHGG